ncbi:MAG: heme-binding beta-barrel domain-containing protein [Planctomycetota bacterium]|jgi:hypothetical protein
MTDEASDEASDVNYGPLAGLIGTWTGDQGMDISPEPDGTEENPYYETIVFEGCGTVENAESQTLAIVRYHQVVTRKADDEVFHDQIGYWTWDASDDTIAQSLAIPRAVTVLAGGTCAAPANAGDAVTLKVSAKAGDTTWGIAQSPFMAKKARTTAFEHTVTIDGDRMHYAETTFLEIYGRGFEHKDENTLTRGA